MTPHPIKRGNEFEQPRFFHTGELQHLTPQQKAERAERREILAKFERVTA